MKFNSKTNLLKKLSLNSFYHIIELTCPLLQWKRQRILRSSAALLIEL
ncbi:hypothetical protein SAMN05216378_3703 [Paenibacillus catalpae]|uniref:Uncharacterized protein n=1 Tax=Paenibacillus catalpae TaxID=1045775 RepID=A0A1I2BX54_9BACL|nr:hypothetical protein SAMN05216378_3703 [Paenibacillus catalpae]